MGLRGMTTPRGDRPRYWIWTLSTVLVCLLAFAAILVRNYFPHSYLL